VFQRHDHSIPIRRPGLAVHQRYGIYQRSGSLRVPAVARGAESRTQFTDVTRFIASQHPSPNRRLSATCEVRRSSSLRVAVVCN
jgi:hypothetical protein